jgi:hypothetical protein
VITATAYLNKIEPTPADRRGRLRDVPEEQTRVFAAVRDVLRASDPGTPFAHVVALSMAAAQRHGADAALVWGHVRRWRAANRPEPVQLVLGLNDA